MQIITAKVLSLVLEVCGMSMSTSDCPTVSVCFLRLLFPCFWSLLAKRLLSNWSNCTSTTVSV